MTSTHINPADIKALECKHVTYQKATDGSGDDILVIKEVVHMKDGSKRYRIRNIINFEREFYITRPDKRNHQQKKEEEDIENCIEYKCTQANMGEMIQRALGSRTPNPNKDIHEVCSSPYVYMADITTPTLLKAKYKSMFPDAISDNKVAVLDIETNMLGTDEERNNPILITVTCGDEKLVGILNSYASKIPNCSATVDRMYTEQLSNVQIKDDKGVYKTHNLVEERGKKITYFYDNKPGALFAQIMKRVHAMMPDFVAIWNMNFDLPRLIKCLEREGYNVAEVFSDPSVPEQFRYAKYIEAKAKKVTNSKTISKHPADLWHVMDCPCGFYWVDAMVLFKNIRTANGNEPSYSLDAVLKKYLGIGKLKFKEIEGEGTARWHITMQRDYPAEYIVYNIFDCVSVELLDDKTKDIKSTISALIDISELKIFPSLPKRLVDILTFFYKDRGKVPGSCGSVDTSGIDEHVISLSGWIVTLPAYMVVKDGLNCIEECPEIVTMFRTQTADDDLAQAYPTGEVSQNISKDTTAIEVLSISDVSEAARRRAGINLTGGNTNAIECANDLLNLPYIHDVLDEFMKDIELEDLENDDSAASGN